MLFDAASVYAHAASAYAAADYADEMIKRQGLTFFLHGLNTSVRFCILYYNFRDKNSNHGHPNHLAPLVSAKTCFT